jgi:hypothetical protein
MQRSSCLVPLLAACTFLGAGGAAQSQSCAAAGTGAGVQVGGCSSGAAGSPNRGLPRNVRLPDEDFVWRWGARPVDDSADRDDFSIEGTEERFFCRLVGAFPRTSNFEALLSTTRHFIRDATDELNRIFVDAGESNWATLSCRIPEEDPSEEVLQERADKALERAERQRERRREQ